VTKAGSSFPRLAGPSDAAAGQWSRAGGSAFSRGSWGGISSLSTVCSKSQARFSNLLSLTQAQNNMWIKNNNNNKKAQLPRQSAPAHA